MVGGRCRSVSVSVLRSGQDVSAILYEDPQIRWNGSKSPVATPILSKILVLLPDVLRTKSWKGGKSMENMMTFCSVSLSRLNAALLGCGDVDQTTNLC